MTRARRKPSEPALTRVWNYREHSCSRMFYGSSGHPLRSLPLATQLPLPLSFSAFLWPLRSVLPSLSIRVLSPGRASLSWPRFSLLLCSGSLSLSLSLAVHARSLSRLCPSFVWQRLRELRLPAHFAGSCSGFPGHGACSIFYNLLSPSSLTPTGQGFLPHELAPPARSLRRTALGHSASTTSTPIVPGHASPSL